MDVVCGTILTGHQKGARGIPGILTKSPLDLVREIILISDGGKYVQSNETFLFPFFFPFSLYSLITHFIGAREIPRWRKHF